MKMRNTNPDYVVGYGRPPAHSRFKKGQSGNPTGRRRYTQTARARLLMSQELFRRMTVRQGDKVVQIPALQAMIRSLLLTAIKGKSAAARNVVTILKMVEAEGQGNSAPVEVRWLSHEEALDALDQAPTKIVRTIVDPNQETDLSRLTEPEKSELERLLSKARKAKAISG
jgi:hypothetical protein